MKPNPNNFNLHLGGDVHRCTPDNAEIFIHAEKWKLIDHIWRISDDPEERARRLGMFVWREILGDEAFEDLGDFMRKTYMYPIHYRPEPTEEDMQLYLDFCSQDIETTEPPYS